MPHHDVQDLEKWKDPLPTMNGTQTSHGVISCLPGVSSGIQVKLVPIIDKRIPRAWACLSV